MCPRDDLIQRSHDIAMIRREQKLEDCSIVINIKWGKKREGKGIVTKLEE